MVFAGFLVEVGADAVEQLVAVVVDGGDAGEGLVEVVTHGVRSRAGRCGGGSGGVLGCVGAGGGPEAVEFVGELGDLGLDGGGQGFGLPLLFLSAGEFPLGALLLFVGARELLLGVVKSIGVDVCGAQLVAFAGQVGDPPLQPVDHAQEDHDEFRGVARGLVQPVLRFQRVGEPVVGLHLLRPQTRQFHLRRRWRPGVRGGGVGGCFKQLAGPVQPLLAQAWFGDGRVDQRGHEGGFGDFPGQADADLALGDMDLLGELRQGPAAEVDLFPQELGELPSLRTVGPDRPPRPAAP
ncbi:hypothetical protein [Streptomyces olivaceus]|uniref:hypothetical protein n=1 Tax=Streptomyces olivaceus TaxID=47716 RepID=UPI0036EB04CD